MKRSAATLLAALALVVVASAASAQSAREGTIRILGRASVEVPPDHVTVRVGISNRAPTPTAALDQNSAIAKKIIDFAKAFGIAERDIQTDAVNLAPVFKTVQEAGGRSRQEPDGYSATNMVRVKLIDLTRLGAFMRQALDQGATNINSVQFGLSNPEKHVDEASKKAFENAAHQAALLTEAAKVKLGPIREIAHPPRSELRGAATPTMHRAAAPSRAPVPVEAGVIEVISEVDVTWRIE
jgi:uncharacterized protein YggE